LDSVKNKELIFAFYLKKQNTFPVSILEKTHFSIWR